MHDINAMLDALVRSIPPRWDIALAIKRRQLAPMYALYLWRTNKLNEMAPAELLPPLLPAMTRWLQTKTYSDEHTKSISRTIRVLTAQKPDATLGDLPALLQHYRQVCEAAGHAVTFNHARACVQAFVRGTLRRHHPLYRDVADVSMLRVEQLPVRRAQTPTDLVALLLRLPQPLRNMALSMAVTGMGPKEYWGQWAIAEGAAHVHIHGTKRKARVRDVPRWAPELPQQPSRSRHWFRIAWSRRLGGELMMYDLRRSFAVWMEEAGIPRSRRRMYLGHAAGDVTELYERRELRAWLAEDAERLQGYAGEAVQRALAASEPAGNNRKPLRPFQRVDGEAADATAMSPQTAERT